MTLVGASQRDNEVANDQARKLHPVYAVYKMRGYAVGFPDKSYRQNRRNYQNAARTRYRLTCIYIASYPRCPKSGMARFMQPDLIGQLA